MQNQPKTLYFVSRRNQQNQPKTLSENPLFLSYALTGNGVRNVRLYNRQTPPRQRKIASLHFGVSLLAYLRNFLLILLLFICLSRFCFLLSSSGGAQNK